jgi:starch synthase
VKVAWDDPLAHRIEAGADMFFMPSRYEPCGLSQIYSLRYGTVPVVRATGGLDDTIDQFDPNTGRGTGFKFADYTAEAFLAAVRDALAVYRQKALWQRLQASGMAREFSWQTAAEKYVRLYELARKTRIRAATLSSN